MTIVMRMNKRLRPEAALSTTATMRLLKMSNRISLSFAIEEISLLNCHNFFLCVE
jgi:hypothetical protein